MLGEKLMAGEIITTQELADAKVDAKDLGETVNEDKVVTPRYGDSYMSAPMVSRRLIEMSVPNANYYLTKSALDADLANVAEGQYAMVVNDLDVDSVPTADNGFYCKIGGVWEFVAWNPLAQFLSKITEYLTKSESYTESRIAGYLQDHKLRLLGQHNNDELGVFPTIVDKDNKVVFGFDANKDELFGSGLITASDLEKLGVYSGNSNVLPLVVDNDNKVIFGYDESKDSLVGSFSINNDSAQPTDKPLPFELAPAPVGGWNYILGNGQSLSLGYDSDNVVLSGTQPFSNKTFVSGVMGFGGDYSSAIPLIEFPENTPLPGDDLHYTGETMISGMANYASLSAYKENRVNPSDHVIFSSASGHGSYHIQYLSKPAEWYENNVLGHVRGAKALNDNTVVQCVAWVQGESNAASTVQSNTFALHRSRLIAMQETTQADVQQITGQTTPVPILTYQHSSYATRTDVVHLSLLDVCQKTDMFYFVVPTYTLPHIGDGVHLTAVGHKWMGTYFGRAYKQMMFDKIQPRALMPLGATLNADTVKIKFDVPHKPLVLDHKNFASTENSGFSVFSGSTEIDIESVSIENGDTVVLKLASTQSSTLQVRYAFTYLGAGIYIKEGASGNLHDSCTDTVMINGVEKSLFYHCPHFKINTVSELI